MRHWGWLAVAVLWVIASSPAHAEPLPDGVGACIELLAERGTLKNDDLPLAGVHCPALVEALNAHPWGFAVANTWIEELDAAQLEDLQRLAERYENLGPPDHVIVLSALDGVLQDLPGLEPEAPLSLWDRVLEWLNSFFGGGEDTASESWLSRWLDGVTLPEHWTRRIFVASLVVVVIGALLVVANELRHAGVFRRPGKGAQTDWSRFGQATGTRRRAELSDLESTPLEERPALLLAIIVEALRTRGAAIRPSLTHRELPLLAGPLSETQRSALVLVSGAAERVAFAAWHPRAEELEPVVSRGTALAEALSEEADR